MAYLSLYRKYRSQSFEEVSGQEHVIRTLQNAIRSGRVAHAYLFCGPRGTGKTTTARLLGKALNCENGPTPEPCNQCSACVQITEGRYLDMKEIDAASNRGIDEIRDLRDNVAYAPANGRYKVYVIDEAHQITGDAFNAFLKTLEEPPPHVVFIMATTEAHKIPATIVSRCQKFEYRRATLEQLRDRVAYVAKQEGVEIDDGALTLIAREANGGWRDALSLLEQVLAFCEGKITAKDIYTVLGTVDADTLYGLGEHVRLADGAAAYTLIEAQIAEGKDPRQLLRDLTAHYRMLMLAAAGVAPAVEPEMVARIVEQSRGFGQHRLITGIELLAQIDREARWSEQPRLLLDVALARLMMPSAPPAAAQATQQAAAPAPRQNPPRTEPSRPAPPRSEPPRTIPTPRPTPAATSSPFVDEAHTPVPPRPAPAQPAPTGKFGDDLLPPPPLTVGDARTGDTGDDDFLSAFDTPGPTPSSPRPTSAPPSAPNGAPANPRASSPPPAPAAGSPSIEVLRSKWRLIGEELKRDKKRMIEVALADALPNRFEHDELVIQFPTTTNAEMFTRRGKDFSEPLILAIERVTGIRCRVRAEAGGKSGAGPAPRPGGATPGGPPRSSGSAPSGPATGTPGVAQTPPDRPAPPPQNSLPSMPAAPGSELIHDVLEVFDGRIIDEDDRDSS